MTKKEYVGKQPKVWPILLVGASIIGIGTIFYHYIENLRYLDSLYFSVITLTTIGYGDIVPKTDAGKIFTIFYVLIGISLLAGIANYVLRHALVDRRSKRHPEEFRDIRERRLD